MQVSDALILIDDKAKGDDKNDVRSKNDKEIHENKTNKSSLYFSISFFVNFVMYASSSCEHLSEIQQSHPILAFLLGFCDFCQCDPEFAYVMQQ